MKTQKLTLSLKCFRAVFTGLLTVIFSFLQGEAQGAEKSFYSYTPDGKVEYNLSKEKIIVKFKPGFNLGAQAEVLKKIALLKPLTKEMMLPSPLVTLAELHARNITDEQVLHVIMQLNQDPNVVYANPFLIYTDGTLQGITETFFVKLKSQSDYYLLADEARKNSLKIRESYKYDKLLYFIEVDKSTGINALAMANKLTETRKFAAAEPDFLLLLKKFNTNDTYIDYQWALNNTGSAIQYNGTPGADMSVFNAWGISTGSAAIKIAVIDEGVDLVHPDLINNLLPGYDGTLQGSGGAPQGNDAHGTACAGIIAAQGNNGMGVAGVAYSSKIIPVRIAYGSGSGWVTNSSWIGTSIDWAWDVGDADVLSNSWGGGAPSSLINDPITRATTLGRGGLGSVVLFAAGNSSQSAAAYPSTQPDVIAVIAMSMCNQRKSYTSCDGESFWGSNYGTAADVAAPGVKIYTCDISGAAGYRAGDYMETFNGTSSACPNAAGVMALILSTNPALNYTQARQILESSCDKVGGYGYNGNVANQPNGTWSTELGYGKVNAFNALQLANPQPCGNPPAPAVTLASQSSFCISTNVTLSLSYLSPYSGLTYQWQSSANNTVYSNIIGATNTFHIATVSATTWYRCKVICTDSTFSTPVQVTLTDPTISTFPSTQNFNSSSLPCGWAVQNVNNDPSTWTVSGSSYRTFYNSMVYAKSTTLAADDWLFSAPLSLTAGTNYLVRFWYKGRSVSLPEKLELKWGISQNAAGMTSATIFSNTNITNTTYALGISSAITPTASGIYYVGFHVFSNANMYDLNIDDVTFEISAPCTVPLLGGTITGPSTMSAGNGTLTTFALSGNTGIDIQWEVSADNGLNWSPIAGQIYSTANIWLNLGNYLLRAKSSSSTCPDAYSNALAITVIPRVGDSQSDPIEVTLLYEEYFTTAPGSGFTSTYTGPNAQPSPDVFFRVTMGPCADTLLIGTCGSGIDTYLHILDASGNHILSLDDPIPAVCGNRVIKWFGCQPNTTYIIVIEGFGTAAGMFGLGLMEIDDPVYAPPITPGGPTTFCSGGSVDLTASGGASYLWSTGSTSATINVTTSGNYTVTATDANGCVGSSTIAVNVVASLTWYADADNDGFGNAASSLSDCNQPVGYVSNNTDCDDGNGLINTPQLYYTDADGDGFGALTYSFFCTTTPPTGYTNNNTDCNDNSNTVYPGATEICFNGIDDDCDGLTDENCCNVIASATTTTATCTGIANGAVNLTVTNAASPVLFLWSNGATTEDLSLVIPGTYTVTVTDNNGCTATTSAIVGSSGLVPSAPPVINGPSGACRNQTGVVFTVTPIATATSYLWTLPSGATGVSTTHSITLNFASNYSTGNICVRAVNACGQSTQFCRSVTRYTSAPVTPNSISGQTAGVCPSTNQTYSISAVANATSYIWTAPTNASITSGQGTTTVTVTFASNFGTSGTLSVRSSNCIGNSSNRTLTINRTPGTPASITSVSSVCRNQVGVAFSTINTVGFTYTWTVPAGCTITSGQGTNAIVVTWGTASGTVSVRANVSCASSGLRNKSITAVTCSRAQADENIGIPLTVYPNPVNQHAVVNFSTTLQSNYQLNVSDATGKTVIELEGTSIAGTNSIELNMSKLSNGLYFLRLSNAFGNIETVKLFKQ